MRVTDRCGRGFGTMTALFISVLLLLVGLALLANAMSVSRNALAETTKAQVVNAANGGLDTAMEALDLKTTATQCVSGTIGGYSFTCGMVGSFQSTTPQAHLTDPCTGRDVTIDKGLEIAWGKSSTAGGDRPVCIEALVSPPVPEIVMPNTAIAANRNIYGGGHVPIRADSTDTGHPHDADVYANGYISKFTTSVDGNTYAVGSDSQPGYDNKTTHSGANPLPFPSSSDIAAFQKYVLTKAQSGTQLTAAQLIANGTRTYGGPVYIDGNVNLTQNTLTFGGEAVYINGSLCVSGQARVVNAGGGIIVVAQQFAQSGLTASYQVGSNPNGVLAVLGADATPPCPANNGPYAASFSGNANMDLGIVWTTKGSIDMAGNGDVTGMLVSGKDVVFNGGGSGGSFTFDHELASRHITMPAYARLLVYGEY
jgi:hypothetical protein